MDVAGDDGEVDLAQVVIRQHLRALVELVVAQGLQEQDLISIRSQQKALATLFRVETTAIKCKLSMQMLGSDFRKQRREIRLPGCTDLLLR